MQSVPLRSRRLKIDQDPLNCYHQGIDLVSNFPLRPKRNIADHQFSGTPRIKFTTSPITASIPQSLKEIDQRTIYATLSRLCYTSLAGINIFDAPV